VRDENAEIADWPLRLTFNQKNWGFGMCYLYLRNVKRFGWNHKRVYRIYRELELNLRIKPGKRLVREKPQPLTVPESINEVWFMDFMHDQLSDGRSFRLFNVLDDFNREAGRAHPSNRKRLPVFGCRFGWKRGVEPTRCRTNPTAGDRSLSRMSYQAIPGQRRGGEYGVFGPELRPVYG
jgi:hypothetical protein